MALVSSEKYNKYVSRWKIIVKKASFSLPSSVRIHAASIEGPLFYVGSFTSLARLNLKVK